MMASLPASRSMTLMRCCGWIGSASMRAERLHLLVPLRHALLRRLEEAAVLVPLQERRKGGQRLVGIAHEGNVGGEAVAGSHRVGLDLHDGRLAGLGQVLRVREVRADHEERVAGLHDRFGGGRAEEPDARRS